MRAVGNIIAAVAIVIGIWGYVLVSRADYEGLRSFVGTIGALVALALAGMGSLLIWASRRNRL